MVHFGVCSKANFEGQEGQVVGIEPANASIAYTDMDGDNIVIRARTLMSSLGLKDDAAKCCYRVDAAATNHHSVRAGPGKAFPVVGALTGNQLVHVLEAHASGEWLRIVYEGRDDRWTMQRLADTGAIYLRPESDPIKPTQLKPTPTQVTLDKGCDVQLYSNGKIYMNDIESIIIEEGTTIRVEGIMEGEKASSWAILKTPKGSTTAAKVLAFWKQLQDAQVSHL